MKQVIFNVGGALSIYTEINDKKLVIDIGKGNNFNPVIDFLYPLFEKRQDKKINNKYFIDQLIISHPHNDHISSITDFDKYFYSDLITCPNDNLGMEKEEKINWDFFDQSNKNLIKLRELIKDRIPPLKSSCDGIQFLYYIPPKICENNESLQKESYQNNISISVFLIMNNYRIFMPGDLQKEGMEFLIKNRFHLGKDSPLVRKLQGGVDLLIAPHHGLRSSFSTFMFDNIKNNKTRCLNIISEKVNGDDNRQVDSRYSSKDYCDGENNLMGGNGIEKCYQVKTSRGHIFIDYKHEKHPYIEIINDNEELIKKFG